MHQVLPTESLMQLSFSKLSQIVIKILWDIAIDIVAETVKRGKRNNRIKNVDICRWSSIWQHKPFDLIQLRRINHLSDQKLSLWMNSPTERVFLSLWC